MKRRYITAQSDRTAEMLFHGFIGQEIRSREFASELLFLDSLNLEKITIRVNSGGGDVFEGISMFFAVLATNTPIHIIVEGLAASMAAFFIQAADHIAIFELAMIMTHSGSFEGRPASDPSQEKLLENANNSIKTILKKRTEMSDEEINEILSQDTWFTADEALESGLVDEVLDMEDIDQQEAEELMEEVSAILDQGTKSLKNKRKVNTVRPIFAKYDKFLKPKSTNMKELIASLIAKGILKADATEADFKAYVNSLEAKTDPKDDKLIKETGEKLTAAQAEVDKLKVDLESAKGDTEEMKKGFATDLVAKAIEVGKFKEDAKEHLIKLGTEDLEALKAIIGNTEEDTSHPGRILAAQTPGVGDKNASKYPSFNNKETFKQEDRSTWNHRDWDKNDPEGLNAMAPDKVEALYNACYPEGVQVGVETH